MASVYLLQGLDSFSEQDLLQADAFLSLQRRQRVRAYRMPADQKRSAAVYLLLRYALKREYGIHATPDFLFTKWGKPTLKDISGVYFNLSHSRDMAVCAVSRSPVGTDVQEISPHIMEVLPYAMTEAEQRTIQANAHPSWMATFLWTVKESYLKYKGIGLIGDMKDLDGSQLTWESSVFYQDCRFTSCKLKDHFLSVCTEQELPTFIPVHKASLLF